jgi:hypothetical protein
LSAISFHARRTTAGAPTKRQRKTDAFEALALRAFGNALDVVW